MVFGSKVLFLMAGAGLVAGARPGRAPGGPGPAGGPRKLPKNNDDFKQPDWEQIIEAAFPPWEIEGNGCWSLDKVGGTEAVPRGNNTPVGSTEGKWNPCYYTKRFAGLDPALGGYPTPIDTGYPYEWEAPLNGQPGDGSVHRCECDAPADINIASCPKFQHDCGKDCANVSEEGIGHIPPFVPLSALVKEYAKKGARKNVCREWFDFENFGCRVKHSTLDELVKKYFSQDGGQTVTWEPPILLDGRPSSTYFRLEYGGQGCEEDGTACFGPHYCTQDVADDGRIWGDFCPYVHVGPDSGKYRHPHVALAALETWIAHECNPEQCSSEWLDNNPDYPPENPTGITWSEMADNADPMAQPAVPYQWPLAAGEVPDFRRDRARCAYPEPEVPEFSIQPKTGCDAQSTQVSDAAECQLAAEMLGKRFWGGSGHSSGADPKGCIFRTPDNDIYFNSHPTGSLDRGDRKLVCQPQPEPAAVVEALYEALAEFGVGEVNRLKAVLRQLNSSGQPKNGRKLKRAIGQDGIRALTDITGPMTREELQAVMDFVN